MDVQRKRSRSRRMLPEPLQVPVATPTGHGNHSPDGCLPSPVYHQPRGNWNAVLQGLSAQKRDTRCGFKGSSSPSVAVPTFPITFHITAT